MPDLIGKADSQVRALAAQIDDEEALPEELQDLDAPATATPADTESTDDQDETEDDTSDETEEAEADDAEDDEDDGDTGAALDDMF
jgi:large subunit ribosomal protein L10